MKKNQRIVLLVVIVLIIAIAIILIENTFKKTKKTTTTKEETLTAELGTAIGNKAPNIILNDLDSNPVLLSDYKGKKNVIVNFWATWCPPCKEEMPLFQKLYEQNRDEL